MKNGKIHSTWTQNGNVLIRVTDTDKPKEIRTHQHLAQFREDDWIDENISEEYVQPDTSDEESD